MLQGQEDATVAVRKSTEPTATKQSVAKIPSKRKAFHQCLKSHLQNFTELLNKSDSSYLPPQNSWVTEEEQQRSRIGLVELKIFSLLFCLSFSFS